MLHIKTPSNSVSFNKKIDNIAKYIRGFIFTTHFRLNIFRQINFYIRLKRFNLERILLASVPSNGTRYAESDKISFRKSNKFRKIPAILESSVFSPSVASARKVNIMEKYGLYPMIFVACTAFKAMKNNCSPPSRTRLQLLKYSCRILIVHLLCFQ